MKPLACLTFFLSGAAALVFEMLWFHQASLAFGNSIHASSLVLAGFMGGLAIGNGLVSWLGHRIRRKVRLYALLEGAIALSGVALVHLLPELVPFLTPVLRPFVDQPLILNVLRLGAAFALLLLPSIAMGMTLPLLVAALYRHDPRFGRALGLLYGWNTLGAVAGVLVGEILLVRWLGIRGAALAAAGCNAAVLLLALSLARSMDAGAPEAALPDRPPLSGRDRLLLASAFAFGAILLALEVVWFRLLLLKIHGTSLAFAVMLAAVLIGIALGGLVGASLLSRAPQAARALPAVAALAGFACAGTYALHAVLLDSQPGAVFTRKGVALLALPLSLPVCLLSGVLFTLLGEALHARGGSETRSAGLLTLANTAGAMIGPLIGGFLLLPAVGVERAIAWLAAAYGVVALALVLGGMRPRGRAAGLATSAAGVLFVAALVGFPRGYMEEHYLADTIQRFSHYQDSQVAAVQEGLTETSIVIRNDLFGGTLDYRLVTNAHSMSGTDTGSRRYMKLFVYWPVAVHPDPRSALLISYGLGNTAKALTDTRSLERIDVVDISRDILRLSDVIYPDPRDHPLRDPRVRVHVEDGRFFLQTRSDRYDVITGEPPPPKAAGVVNLYTREYFALLRERLAAGGIVTYWLPVHMLVESEAKAILRAFCDVFDDCSLWAGFSLDWLMVGTRDAEGPVSEADFARQWSDPVVGEELRTLGLEVPAQLGALFLMGAPELKNAIRGSPPLDDDHPRRVRNQAGGGLHKARAWFELWLRLDAVQKRFARSELIARLWPPELRAETAAWLRAHRDARRTFLGLGAGSGGLFGRLHEVLTKSSLETLPLWQLGTSVERQLLAGAARDAPAIDRELALGAIARRDWDAAAERLAADGGERPPARPGSRSTACAWAAGSIGLAYWPRARGSAAPTIPRTGAS